MFFKRVLPPLLLLLIAATLGFAGQTGQGTLSGKWITKSNGPMEGAQVLLFNLAVGPPPSSDKYLRVPDVTTTVDSEGVFSVQLPAGKYYLVMRKRADQSTFGPPKDGDLQYYSRDKNGRARQFTVSGGKSTNIGTITEATVFKKQVAVQEKGMSGIEGVVIDENEKPVEGVRVFAYTSPEMIGKPQYASEGTGPDGKFLINISQKGTYYLKVRNHYGGGKPTMGEFMGGYGRPEAPATVEVRKGKITPGIKIIIQQYTMKGSPQ